MKQYRIKFNEKAKYQPDKEKGIWRCACGAVNTETEKRCHSCILDYNELFTLDISALTADKSARLEKERVAAAEKAERERLAAAEKADKDRRLAEERAEGEKAAAEARKQRNKKIGIFSGAAALVIAVVLVVTQVVIPASKYNHAEALLESGDYDGAAAAFAELGDYRDANDRIFDVQTAKVEHEKIQMYKEAEALLQSGDYDGAIASFLRLGDYSDASDRAMSSKYSKAESLLASGDYDDAIATFTELGDYRDVSDRIISCQYNKAEALFESGEYLKSAIAFGALGDYSDAAERVQKIYYALGTDYFAAENYEDAYDSFKNAGQYADSADLVYTAAINCAIQAESLENWEKAVNWYKKVDALEQAYTVEYSYVRSHYNNTDTTTYQFLCDLRNAQYSDSASLYEALYKISVSLIVNMSLKDTVNNYSTIRYKSDSSSIYGHYKITGGYPGQEIELRFVHETRWRGGQKLHDYEIKDDYQYGKEPSTTDDESAWGAIFLRTGSNLEYHRITIYNASTDEQLAQVVVHTPYT